MLVGLWKSNFGSSISWFPLKSLAYLHKDVAFSCPGYQDGRIGARLSFSCSTSFRFKRQTLEITPFAITTEWRAVFRSVSCFNASRYLLVDRHDHMVLRTIGSKSKVAGVAGLRR